MSARIPIAGRQSLSSRKWFYPLIYGILIVAAMLPPYTEVPYDPRHTQDVILNILMRSTSPYGAWGWVFHLATLGIVALALVLPQHAGRAAAAYFGLNHLVIAVLQTHAVTPQYGFALHSGAALILPLLGLLWLGVAWKDKLQFSFREVPPWRWSLLPLALLVFWSPVAVEGSTVVPDFNPLLLLTSPDYGLAYCFMTPVFLFLLIIAYPRVDGFAFRVTAFNGLLYGLFNLSHWFNPDLRLMGVMHLPLLVISLAALIMLRVEKKE